MKYDQIADIPELIIGKGNYSLTRQWLYANAGLQIPEQVGRQLHLGK